MANYYVKPYYPWLSLKAYEDYNRHKKRSYSISDILVSLLYERYTNAT